MNIIFMPKACEAGSPQPFLYFWYHHPVIKVKLSPLILSFLTMYNCIPKGVKGTEKETGIIDLILPYYIVQKSFPSKTKKYRREKNENTHLGVMGHRTADNIQYSLGGL